MWLFLAFLAVPMIEIALFIQVGGAIGLWPTLGIVVLTAVLGSLLVRAQGLLALNNLRASFSRLEDPSEPLAHGAMILVSGVLLLTPGFFTDSIGFALLIPKVRSAVFGFLRKRIHVQRFEMGDTPRPRARDATIVEADYHEVDNDAPQRSGWTKH